MMKELRLEILHEEIDRKILERIIGGINAEIPEKILRLLNKMNSWSPKCVQEVCHMEDWVENG